MTDAHTEARAIARCVRGCATDDQYIELIEKIATALAAKDAELAEVKAERDRAQEFERQHDYCCCGDRIDSHNIGSGHAPVSMFDYEYNRAIERAEAAEAQLAEANKALDQFMDRLEPRWFLEQNWFPPSVDARRALEAHVGEADG